MKQIMLLYVVLNLLRTSCIYGSEKNVPSLEQDIYEKMSPQVQEIYRKKKAERTFQENKKLWEVLRNINDYGTANPPEESSMPKFVIPEGGLHTNDISVSPKTVGMVLGGALAASAIFGLAYTTVLSKYEKYVIGKLNKSIEDYLKDKPWAKNWKLIQSTIATKDITEFKKVLNPSDPEFKNKINCSLFLSSRVAVYIATPVVYCAQKNFYVGAQYLIENGANINEKTKLFFEEGISSLANKISIPSSYYLTIGLTPLHFAVENDNLDMVKLLIKNGAQINSESNVDPRGTNGKLTPLHIACMNSNKPQMMEVVKYLVEHGAQLNPKDINGRAPIDFLMKSPKSENKNKIMDYLKSNIRNS